MKPVFTCLVLILLTFSYSVKAGSIISREAKTDTVIGKIYAVKKLSNYKYIILLKDWSNITHKVIYHNIKKAPASFRPSGKLIGKDIWVGGKVFAGSGARTIYVTNPENINILTEDQVEPNFSIDPPIVHDSIP